MSIFVTGASGFLGAAVVAELSARGYEVVAISRSLGAVPGPVVKAEIDITNGAALASLPWASCESVVHLAASGVKASNRTLSGCVDVNVVGTQKLLNAMGRFAPAASLLHARTYYEDFISHIPALLNNPYVITKAAAWKLCQDWARADKARRLCGFRVFQVYGPKDDINNVLPYAAARLKDGKTVHLGSGSGMKDWIFISDAASAIAQVLAKHAFDGGQFDIGTGSLLSVRDAVKTLAMIAGASEDLLEFDPAKDRPDTEIRVSAHLLPSDWAPAFTFAEGLRAML